MDAYFLKPDTKALNVETATIAEIKAAYIDCFLCNAHYPEDQKEIEVAWKLKETIRIAVKNLLAYVGADLQKAPLHVDQRRYTFSEIRDMRSAIDTMTAIERRHYYERSAQAAEVEDRLRTYMQNGSDPQELVERAQAAQRRQDAEFAEQQKL